MLSDYSTYNSREVAQLEENRSASEIVEVYHTFSTEHASVIHLSSDWIPAESCRVSGPDALVVIAHGRIHMTKRAHIQSAMV
jgi:predicted ATPase